MTEESKTLDKLKSSLEQAKEELKNTDEGIKKLTGRDPADILNYGRRLVQTSGKVEEGNRTYGNFAQKRRSDVDDQDFLPPSKRMFSQITFGSREESPPRSRGGDIYRRLAGGNRWENKTGSDRVPPRRTAEPHEVVENVLTSSVVRVAEKSRQDAIADMKKSVGNAEQQRGRRMLGVLLGTLKRFKSEAAEDEASQVTKRRHQVDNKIDARNREEKQELRRERGDLFRERKERQTRIRVMQQKMRMFEAFKKWEAEVLRMKSFIRTERKPYIFYRPKMHNDKSERMLAASCKAIDDMIAKRRIPLEEEIAALTAEAARAESAAKKKETTEATSFIVNPSSAASAKKKSPNHQKGSSSGDHDSNAESDDSSDDSDEAELVDVALEKMDAEAASAAAVAGDRGEEQEEEDYEDDIAPPVVVVRSSVDDLGRGEVEADEDSFPAAPNASPVAGRKVTLVDVDNEGDED